MFRDIADSGSEGEIGPNLDMPYGADIERLRAAVTGGIDVTPTL